MTLCSISSDREKKRYFEYPFSKTWVFASVVITVVSLVFAILFLIDEDLQEFSFNTLTLTMHPLLLYFVFTSLLTAAVLALKYYLYSTKEEISESYFSENERKARSILRRWILIILILLTVAALFLPIVLSYFLGPLWSFLGISGFIPAVSIPEIILYIYSLRRQNKE